MEYNGPLILENYLKKDKQEGSIKLFSSTVKRWFVLDLTRHQLWYSKDRGKKPKIIIPNKDILQCINLEEFSDTAPIFKFKITTTQRILILYAYNQNDQILWLNALSHVVKQGNAVKEFMNFVTQKCFWKSKTFQNNTNSPKKKENEDTSDDEINQNQIEQTQQIPEGVNFSKKAIGTMKLGIKKSKTLKPEELTWIDDFKQSETKKVDINPINNIKNIIQNWENTYCSTTRDLQSEEKPRKKTQLAVKFKLRKTKTIGHKLYQKLEKMEEIKLNESQESDWNDYQDL